MGSFEELIYSNNIGFYKSCDLIKIFIINKSENKFINFFTLFIFKEEDVSNSNLQKITNNLEDVDDNHSIGIIKKELSLNESKKFFEKLSMGIINEEISNIWINGSQLVLIDKQFVFNGSTRINNILKENDSGSYIFEFFEEDKKELDFTLNNDEIFNKINSIIKTNTNFDFELTKDCIGNYIFQLPLTLLYTNENFDANDLEINFNWNSKLEKKYPNCIILISSKSDDIYTTTCVKKYNFKDKQTIKLGRRYEDFILSIISIDEELLLLKKNISLILEIDMNIKIPRGERRVKHGNNMIPIPLETIYESKLNQQKFKLLIEDTKIKNRENKLKKEKSIIEYNRVEDINQFDRFDDLIYLINKYGQDGVYIWDTYLNASDLLETVYHLKYYNAPIRAITSKKIKEKYESDDEEITIEDIININKEIISESDLTGLNLEFRIELGKPSFHDRFLIFPRNPTLSKNCIVYSLGSSINGFRKSSHILQKVQIPNDILNSFNELWDSLSEDRNKIW